MMMMNYAKKPAHAVPLASTRQHPENQRKTGPAIRRGARWRVEEAHPGFPAGAEGPERARVGSRLPHPGGGVGSKGDHPECGFPAGAGGPTQEAPRLVWRVVDVISDTGATLLAGG